MSEEPQQQTLLPEPVKRAPSSKSLASSQYGEAAVEILKSAGMKGMHVDDVVAAILDNHALVKDPPEYIKAKVNAYLSTRAWKDGKPIVGSEIRRVMNPKTKTYKKGWYRYQKPKEQPAPPPTPVPLPNPTYLGTAGEYAAASEFLYNGYNVSIPAVDTGIDLIVFKNGHFSNIQVKTATESNNKYQFTIKSKAFANNSGIDTFYCLICRRLIRNTYRNDFIILPSTAIAFFVSSGYVTQSESSISFNISFDESNNVMINGKQNITMYLNRF
ncbi:MAG: group I intron-associated PD-(D/E)XK endonuclease [Gammaproteobacteria bacterium]|nr:group I intron-associated PD-(D/E)XK endonuclease [Gammaproteobacteria bacterium]